MVWARGIPPKPLEPDSGAPSRLSPTKDKLQAPSVLYLDLFYVIVRQLSRRRKMQKNDTHGETEVQKAAKHSDEDDTQRHELAAKPGISTWSSNVEKVFSFSFRLRVLPFGDAVAVR